MDPEGIVWLREFLKDYANEGNTVFVSSHLLSEMALMAENVVVIGRGKLITNTSVKQLQNSSPASTFVRSSKLAELERVLKTKAYDFHAMDSGLLVAGAHTDEVGMIAFDAQVPILELTAHNASLEEAFLELTSDAQEYHAKPEKKGKRT